jgi:nucleoside-diphosphate-sugar epimerase
MLGRSASQHFLKKGYKVTSISLPADETKDMQTDGVEHILKDVNSVSDTEILRIMKEKDYMVIAIGADERYTPKAPAIDFYRRYNVTYISNLLRLARLAKIQKVVILGSYFTYFNKIWPELKLAQKHPYIRSRVEQIELAFTFNSNVMQVVVLEIPYVFGKLPKNNPLWSMISEQLNSTKHIYYSHGGTAMTTENEVAEAIEGAILYADGGKTYPVASINWKWKDFLSYLLKVQGQQHKILTPYSNFCTKREMKKKNKKLKKQDRESGINLVEFLKFQKRNAFLDIPTCIQTLRYNPDDLKKAIKDTLLSCDPKQYK